MLKSLGLRFEGLRVYDSGFRLRVYAATRLSRVDHEL